MATAYPAQLVNLIDISAALAKDLTRDKNRFKNCIKDVRAFDMELRNELDSARALNILDEDLFTLMTLVGGYIFKREQILQKFELYINNKIKIGEILIEFCDISETMQTKTRTLSEKLKFFVPYVNFPVIHAFVDFYSQKHDDDHIEDMELVELKRTIKGVLQGIVPVTDFEAKFNSLYNKQDSLIERLKTFSSDSGISSLKEQLEKQRETLVELKNYFKDGNRDRLTKSLEELDKNPNCLEQINELLSVKETSDQFMTCFRCGELNSADFQFCRKCSAALVIEKNDSVHDW
jgi:hypothetical protein